MKLIFWFHRNLNTKKRGFHLDSSMIVSVCAEKIAGGWMWKKKMDYIETKFW